MQNLDLSQLASVTGGNDTLNNVGGWLRERAYDFSEGKAMMGATMGIDEFHPPNAATFAKYDALRQMHGRAPRANLGNP